MTKYLSIYLSLSLSGHPSCSKSTSKGWPTRPDNTVLSGLWRRVTAHWRWRARACHELPTTVEVQVVTASLSLSLSIHGTVCEGSTKLLLLSIQSSKWFGNSLSNEAICQKHRKENFKWIPFQFPCLLPLPSTNQAEEHLPQNPYGENSSHNTELCKLANYGYVEAGSMVSALNTAYIWWNARWKYCVSELRYWWIFLKWYAGKFLFLSVRWEICCLDLCRFLVFQMPSNGFGGESSVFRRRYLGFVRRRKRRGQESRSDSRKYQIATVGRNS